MKIEITPQIQAALDAVREADAAYKAAKQAEHAALVAFRNAQDARDDADRARGRRRRDVCAALPFNTVRQITDDVDHGKKGVTWNVHHVILNTGPKGDLRILLGVSRLAKPGSLSARKTTLYPGQWEPA